MATKEIGLNTNSENDAENENLTYKTDKRNIFKTDCWNSFFQNIMDKNQQNA